MCVKWLIILENVLKIFYVIVLREKEHLQRIQLAGVKISQKEIINFYKVS